MTLIQSNSTKKKRVSRKNKTAWRKHIDIKDVDEFLDEQRQTERIGKFSDKTNDELFIVDTEPHRKQLTRRQQRKTLGERTPKAFAALENTSKVLDPIVKRNRVRTKEERKHFIAKSIAAVKAAKGIIPKRKLQAEADRLSSYKKLDERVKANKTKKVVDTDIWSVGNVIEQRTDLKNQWIAKYVVEHTLANTGTPITSIPKQAFHKRSQLKKVKIPHPGTSYNPTLKDHQDLLNTVMEFEEKIIKNEDHLNRVTTSMFEKMTAEQRDAARRKEMNSGIEGLDDDDDKEADESGSDDSDSYRAVNPPVEVKKKDKKSRRKAREQKQIMQNLLKAKLEKKKITDIHRLRHLKEDIAEMEAQLKVMRAKKQVRKVQKKLEPRRIGKLKFSEGEVDFSMPQAISGNLRNVKTEGSILKDRFKSMQERNILVPTVDLGLRRRREVKRFVKRTHKEEEPQPNASKLKPVAKVEPKLDLKLAKKL